MRCRIVLALCAALCLAAVASLVPPARADGIRLEPLLRLATEAPAWAVAVDSERQRLLVAEGEHVREYVLLAAGMVVPAISEPAHLLGQAVEMVVDGDVFVATQRGVCRFDPRRPGTVSCRAGFSATGLHVAGGHVYVTAEDWDHNECGLWVLDRALLLQSKWVDPCWCGDLIQGFSDVAVHGSDAYVAAYGGGGFTGYLDGAVGLLDVSQPSDPRWNGVSYCLTGLPSRITLSDGRAYVAQRSDGYTPYLRPGLSVLELRAEELHLVGHLDLAGDVTSLALAQPYALAGDDEGRVWAIDVGAAGGPQVVAWSDTHLSAHDVAVCGTEVYLAEGEGGLLVLQMVAVPEPTPTPKLETAEGTLTRVEYSFCQAGETHVLPESNVYLYSDLVPLRAYERRYVQVWGWEVESPECRLLNVTDIAVLQATPTERPTPATSATPTRPAMSIYLPLMRKM
jgi:hypothetical protein